MQGLDIYKSTQVRDKQIFRILGQVFVCVCWFGPLIYMLHKNVYLQAPTIAAAAFLKTAGKPPVLPLSNLSYAENLLYMMESM